MTLGFKLCQPGGNVSCGACCGLYNFADHSRATLTDALLRRTRALAEVPRERTAFASAAAAMKADEAPPLFRAVRVCPLLGFIDGPDAAVPDASRPPRIGCLGHPAVTGGADLRDCGAYHAQLCETFECPSFLWLTPAEARLVRDACDDWYVYGLVVTDVEFVRGCLRLLERGLGSRVDCDAVRTNASARAAMAALFRLKETAPERRADAAALGRFIPDGTGDGEMRTLAYAELGARSAPEDDVVLCLGYAPRSADELERARSVVRQHVRRIVEAMTDCEETAA